MRAGRPREESAAIREWATGNGLDVSARGRISSTVLEAYENRGKAAVATAPVATAPVAAAPVVELTVEAEAKPKRRTRKKAAAES